jgi:DNA modification methylase
VTNKLKDPSVTFAKLTKGLTTADFTPEYTTRLGIAYRCDSLDLLRALPSSSVDLIVTSPPFGLVRKKAYGNEDADNYVQWFLPFGIEMRRVLKRTGSLVLDIGGSWERGRPIRSLYHIELLLALCKEVGFHLAQDFYWWNPARLPTPAEWVTVRRVRVKDSVNSVYWLSKSPYPKASNRRVLQPYSTSMLKLFTNGYNSGKRPSGHVISGGFGKKHKGSIPSNLLAIANTESYSRYQLYCRKHKLTAHPARFPDALPGFFIKMLSDRGDVVIDPFFGSGVTGAVAEQLGRRWIGGELNKEYLRGSKGRFVGKDAGAAATTKTYTLTAPNVTLEHRDLPKRLGSGLRRKQTPRVTPRRPHSKALR